MGETFYMVLRKFDFRSWFHSYLHDLTSWRLYVFIFQMGKPATNSLSLGCWEESSSRTACIFKVVNYNFCHWQEHLRLQEVAHPFSLCVLQTLDEMARGCQWAEDKDQGHPPNNFSVQGVCTKVQDCYSVTVKLWETMKELGWVIV